MCDLCNRHFISDQTPQWCDFATLNIIYHISFWLFVFNRTKKIFSIKEKNMIFAPQNLKAN